MRRHWRTGVTQLVLGLCLLMLLGAPFGASLTLLFLGLLGYASWSTWQLVRLHRWLDGRGGGDPPESYGMWGDVFDGIYTLQKKQKKSRKRLRKIAFRVRDSLSSLRDGVIMLDSERSLEWWNEAATEMFGFRDPQDKGQHITNLVRAPVFLQYFSKGDFSDPLEMESARASGRFLQIHITEFARADHLVLVRDITRLHALEQMRRDFVANLSHELKTPLTVLRGYLETLMAADTLPERSLQEIVDEMHRQGERMDHLIRDLLFLSRLENEDRPTLSQPVCLPQLLERVVRDARVIAENKQQQVTLQLESAADILGSESELYSAFSNLITNAVKYSPPGSRIEVVTRDTSNSLEVIFLDNGTGIDFQHLNRLTERFYRVDKHRSVEAGGTGLGLAIVKHVLLRHEAHLIIRSEVGEGSEFICRFSGSRVQPASAA